MTLFKWLETGPKTCLRTRTQFHKYPICCCWLPLHRWNAEPTDCRLIFAAATAAALCLLSSARLLWFMFHLINYILFTYLRLIYRPSGSCRPWSMPLCVGQLDVSLFLSLAFIFVFVIFFCGFLVHFILRTAPEYTFPSSVVLFCQRRTRLLMNFMSGNVLMWLNIEYMNKILIQPSPSQYVDTLGQSHVCVCIFVYRTRASASHPCTFVMLYAMWFIWFRAYHGESRHQLILSTEIYRNRILLFLFPSRTRTLFIAYPSRLSFVSPFSYIKFMYIFWFYASMAFKKKNSNNKFQLVSVFVVLSNLLKCSITRTRAHTLTHVTRSNISLFEYQIRRKRAHTHGKCRRV